MRKEQKRSSHIENYLFAEIILKLKGIFGNKAIDIQHVGSTAIQNIKAKPMFDIAVGVDGFDGLDKIFPKLEKIGIYKSSTQPLPDDIFCAMKETRERPCKLSRLYVYFRPKGCL